MLKAIKVRLYPTTEQQESLAKSFGCARWYWNYSLNECIQHYEKTGKSLKMSVYKGVLPKLKVEHTWLKEDCYSSVLQCVAINLNKAYSNFFEGRAKFPRFKSRKGKQSIQYPQNVTVVKEKFLKIPKIGEVEAVFHRPIKGTIKTVTISKTPSDKYFASVLCSVEGTEDNVEGDKIVGIDLGLKDFAIVHDGEKVEKFANPKHLKRHEKNLARKQKKHARKPSGSKSKEKSRKLIAKVHERVANTRQDFLHKLSRKLVDESQVITVENLNVKGMKRNRKLSKSISDVGWGMFVNFLDYKLQKRSGKLIEIDRFFPSSKMCSCCNHVVDKLTLDIRQWDCPKCLTHHDRDGNAALNIRNEGIRIMNSPACQEVNAGGNPGTASGGNVRPTNRKGTKAVAIETGSLHRPLAAM
ncbi:transposase [Aetokthonos hydrillicola Thurmond2011]|uniref:Transposase n=1 Tax=Aetokthonos hydrillicola Thurmond2011 TaxID=2712845 RepID=A0AAP5I753_9CYAN|nr:RNA-guided endonuclease TnpB family protein [Aetokthonos hydrillicola]MBO3461670.1 IS200/IS605 family element transposase accessory protein TnpB [Aetokthonos hydrillicola CCALA 1050]MBW4588717.1 transposase [Aetokthonos hydrillicola CCALA 1050]MDR9895949.1 transposase [Aetokthonos hydrillicola Thurmond2011]